MKNERRRKKNKTGRKLSEGMVKEAKATTRDQKKNNIEERRC
jgi:hypothetical protein